MINFELSSSQLDKIDEWMKTLPGAYAGAIGGRFTYSFTPTSLGVIAKVRDCISKEEIDLTESENW